MPDRDDDLEIRKTSISDALRISRSFCEKLNRAKLWEDMHNFLETEEKLISLISKITPDKNAPAQIRQRVDLELIRFIL